MYDNFLIDILKLAILNDSDKMLPIFYSMLFLRDCVIKF